ncbi:MAG: threonine synthase [Candidatus Doudnabacteria bacterium CG10_big_fil_rev_8_21_14_0_10_42_18]|uniref:Threonine synthase n=1 Tax=Candidatus Doudnabacteria bacterium CG10_big_fil_rev_8_21_14_0_10_42_18 TaxID=1974552 RepID=A0A2H0VB58_9BACT|nr:MAG: threonine synthase [Candidatus Doudnabacteria bacterium CG10_big_fil_rev_8_21_14_0_10_42_18]
MKYSSTSGRSRNFSFKDAVLLGLAPDSGLFMPNELPHLPKKFFKELGQKSFSEIAEDVAKKYIEEISVPELQKIIKGAFSFPVPLKQLDESLYVLELFHGPTMAFKDFGARFLARAMGYFARGQETKLNIIVATSGDTGSAVASGFFKVPRAHVYILYPSKKVSAFQEKQLTTYGHNITALEVKGTFDDCQRLAKQVLGDGELNGTMKFSSANSINFGRLLPQSFYYFYAAGQLQRKKIFTPPVFVVPSGNFGHLTSGLLAKRMGLNVFKFLAATNANNTVPKYLATGKYRPKASKHTISNAMDVGNPSNFARMSELYGADYKKMGKDISGVSVTDALTRQTIAKIYKRYNYILDPHTAVGVAAVTKPGFVKRRPTVVLGTAHPAKFKEMVEPVIKRRVGYPPQLKAAVKKKKHSILVSKDYKELKKVLMNLN